MATITSGSTPSGMSPGVCAFTDSYLAHENPKNEFAFQGPLTPMTKRKDPDASPSRDSKMSGERNKPLSG